MIVKLKDVSKTYRFKKTVNHVLDRVNLDVNYGDFITIQGKSGSGKSTLLNLISGLIKPTLGMVFLEKVDMGNKLDLTISYHRGKLIGFVFQSFNLIPYQTVIENVMAPLKFHSDAGLGHRQKAMEALKAVELLEKADHYPGILSGGQMQRVAIARAIIKEPKLVIADEPTGNLDEKTSQEIVDIFSRLNREKYITFIVVTHDEILTKYANRKFLLKNKQLHQIA
jgi:ABC-type lipoprotein export system ATPase subunit